MDGSPYICYIRYMGTKKCSKCGEHKDLEAFYRDRSKKDGLRSKCKACHSQYYLDNKEARKAYSRRYRKDNLEACKERERRYRRDNAEAVKERHRRYNQENAEAIAEQKRKWYQANAEAMAAYSRQWERDNPDKKAAKQHRRRARMAGVPSDGFVLDIRGQDCYVCGKPAEAVDHVVPLSKGGPDTRINKAPICTGCNSAKKDSVWPGMLGWDGFVARRRALAGA